MVLYSCKCGRERKERQIFSGFMGFIGSAHRFRMIMSAKAVREDLPTGRLKRISIQLPSDQPLGRSGQADTGDPPLRHTRKCEIFKTLDWLSWRLKDAAAVG